MDIRRRRSRAYACAAWTAIIIGMISISAPVQAENYLLPTAVVPPGHVEVELDYRYSRIRSNLAKTILPTGIGSFETSSSILEMTVGAGITKDLQLSIVAPYTTLTRTHQQISGKITSFTWDRAGAGDPVFGLDYRVMNEAAYRPTMTLHAEFKPDTASDARPDAATGKRGGAGTGTTDYGFGLAVSKSLDEQWEPYLTAGTMVSGETDRGLRRGNIWGGSVGTEYRWTGHVTLDARVDARHIGSDFEDGTGPREMYTAEVRAYYALWRNWTVIPSLAFIRTSDYDSDVANDLRSENNRGYGIGVGFYAVY